jgi:hypothetical protein
MKNMKKILIAAAVVGLSALVITAQDSPQGGRPPRGGGASAGGEGGPGGHRPPPMPLLAALDANHDGVIDAGEIANASAALRTLDKNGDGQLTRDEFMPPRPPGGHGPDGQNGPPPPGGPGNSPDGN